MKSALIKRKSLLLAGIKEEDNESNIIPFDNMSLKIGTSDPTNVVIPSFDEMSRVINELKNTVFDTKYTLSYPSETGQKTLPTAAELNAAYDSDGIPAEDINGVLTLLKRTTDGTEEFPVKQMNDGEGLLIVLEANGVFEEAGFTNNIWLIDQTKNQLPQQLIDLENGIKSNADDIALLDIRVTAIDGANSVYLTTANAKPITGYGALSSDTAIVEGDKLAKRDEVKSGLDGLQTKITANTAAATAADTLSKSNKVQLDLNTPAIGVNSGAIIDNNNDIAGHDTRIVALEGEDASHDDRISALEDAESLVDKVWEDGTPISFTGNNGGTASIATIVDQDGSPFTFETNKRLEIYIKHDGTNVGQGHTIVVDSSTPIQYVIPNGNSSDAFTISLGTNGILTGTITNGNDNMSEFAVYRVVEDRAAASVSSSYTKTESDAKYTLKTTTTALDTRVVANKAELETLELRVKPVEIKAENNATNITANTTKIAAKQDATDAALLTSTKSIVGAINESKTLLDTTRTTQAQLGAKVLSDGENLLDTAEVIATEKWVTNTDTALETKIMAAAKAIEDARVKYEKGRVLSYAEQKTTGAFADRTLFSETQVPKGLAILGGTGGIETTGQVGELPILSNLVYNVATGASGATSGTTPLITTTAGAKVYNSGDGGNAYTLSLEFSGDKINKGKDNLAKGVELVAYVYTALKDITNGEMA